MWSLERGARPVRGGVRFSVWAPRAERLVVRIVGAGEVASEHELGRRADGCFAGQVAEARIGTDYFYVLDGARARPDPVSRHQPEGVHGPSRVVDPAAFGWSDADWRGLAMSDLVIYELHVGTFTDAGSFDAVCEHLHGLRGLGITAIEIMPVAEFPGSRNWGYDGAHPYAPQSTYGGPEGLRRLVDAAHAAKLGVILDVVYNHLGPEGNYLRDFGPYFTDQYRTPWGEAINYDGRDSDEVRRYVVDNALYWITEFHVDGLRLDAVHGIFDFSTDHILAELTRAVHAQGDRLRRQTLVIAESDLNDARLVRAPERCGLGLDGQWSDDFHHAIHAALTGERAGYYADFGSATAVAEAFRHRFVLRGGHSQFRRRRHGAPADDAPAERFVVFTQNHDQVGNRARGERLASLVPFEAQKLCAALLLLSPYVPLLFMGQEYGETRPFLYFVSHGDPALALAVREGRRREFASFGWSGEIPDPQCEETFARSRLDRSVSAAAGHAQILLLHHDLLALRRGEHRLWTAPRRSLRVDGGEGGWIALRYRAEDAGLLALFNLDDRPREVLLEDDSTVPWTMVLATDGERYGGNRRESRARIAIEAGALRSVLPATCATVYRAQVY
jgi:maltooligosyltrehalose trehalohydrolase